MAILTGITGRRAKANIKGVFGHVRNPFSRNVRALQGPARRPFITAVATDAVPMTVKVIAQLLRQLSKYAMLQLRLKLLETEGQDEVLWQTGR